MSTLAAVLALLTAGPAQSGPSERAADGPARRPLVAPKPGPRPLTAGAVAGAIADLSADDWARREEATARLAAAPELSAWPLRNAALDADPERRARAVAALAAGLRGAARRRADAPFAACYDALLNLVRFGPPGGAGDGTGEGDAADEAALAALTALRSQPTAVTARAVGEVRRLGGAVMRPKRPGGFGGDGGYSVTLDDRWAGGGDGLKHLRVIAGLTQVHLTDAAPLPPDARAGLLAGRYGNFSVERRGAAFLGVHYDPGLGAAGGCRIGGVTDGGPAALAGLRKGDRIVAFGDVEISTFAGLLNAIRETGEVGELTLVTVIRGGEPLTVGVRLSRWRDDAAEDDDAIDPGTPD